ncbi:MAG TPA: cupin domain-containing protein [Edaphocola sp.]|nr:cupin domain-containing protein [Edaphocola sp.]
MEDKFNEATPLRPEGDRLLNANLVEMDLNKFMEQIRSEITWKAGGHNSITILKTEHLRIVLIGLKTQSELKTHTAPGQISVQVLEGKIKFTADSQSVTLTKGQMISLKPRIPHSVLAEEESFFLLTLAVG